MLRSHIVRFLFSSLFFFIFFQHLLADESDEFVPLYTGTQLAFYSTNVAPGHFSVQPFIFAVRKNGFYNKNWSLDREKNTDALSMTLACETGITDYLDVSLLLNGSYTHYANTHSCKIGPLIAKRVMHILCFRTCFLTLNKARR